MLYSLMKFSISTFLCLRTADTLCSIARQQAKNNTNFNNRASYIRSLCVILSSLHVFDYGENGSVLTFERSVKTYKHYTTGFQSMKRNVPSLVKASKRLPLNCN